MSPFRNNQFRNNGENFFRSLNKIAFFFGAPDYFKSDNKSMFLKTHDNIAKVIDFLLCIFVLLEWLAYLNQQSMNVKQKNDLYMFSISHPFMHAYALSFHYYKDKVKDIIKSLVVDLRKVHNNTDVETHMIKRAKFFIKLDTCLIFMAVFFYGIDGLLQGINKGAPFVTVITSWPDIEDTSNLAGFMRLAFYISWWLINFRFFAVFIFVISLTVCLSHHFRNLRLYFESLNNIFYEMITQEEKDEKYEKAFIIGVNLHIEILKYTKLCEKVFYVAYSSQILLNILSLIILLLQMVESERSLLNTIATVTTVMCVTISTGCFMWNAGDITYEASQLSTAIFGSGWHHCSRDIVVRMKPLLVFSMMMSQRPVQLKCLGIVNISYESHLTIVKSSYSVFSVLY